MTTWYIIKTWESAWTEC